MNDYIIGIRKGREAHAEWIKTPLGTTCPQNPYEKNSDLWMGWYDGFEIEFQKGNY